MRPIRHGSALVVSALLVAMFPTAAAALDTDIDELRATQEVFRNVAESVRPFMVRIETMGGSQPSARGVPNQNASDKKDGEEDGMPSRAPTPFRETTGSNFVVADGPTTGIIYSADGYIIASSFNFVREPLLISVTLGDGRRMVADLVARDQVRKIALLKVDATDLPVPKWRDDSDVRVGEWAVALGLGFGGDKPSVTAGIISATNRMTANALQTDAKLSPANYGGPLCDIHGNIIGICVPMAQRPGELAGIELYDSGAGFVVPRSRVEEIVSVLRTGESFYRGWLGISVNVRARDGVVIRNVADPSPMLAAGVEPGDKILWAEGKELHHFGELVQAIYMIPAGQQVYLTIQRQDRQFSVAMTMARNTELGGLPKIEKKFDPSSPLPLPPPIPQDK